MIRGKRIDRAEVRLRDMRRLPFLAMLVAPSVALVVACSGADSPIVGGGSDDDDDSSGFRSTGGVVGVGGFGGK